MSIPDIHPDRRGYRPGATSDHALLLDAGTVAEALVERARREPAAVAFYLPDEPEPDRRITVADLLARAHAAGAALVAAGVTPGARVCLCLETSAPLLAGLFGAALAGAVPSVLEPPLTAGRREIWLERVRHIVAVARPAVLVCEEPLRATVEAALEGTDVTVISPPFAPGAVAEPVLSAPPDEAAFMQFTSGTTGAAKGIVLSHRAVFASAAAIGAGGPFLADDVMVSWLPLHHDMGMIGGTLSPFLLSLPSVLIRPMAFGSKPDRWLRLIHEYRGTLSPAPNFAYRLVTAVARRTDLSGLDLSCWRTAFNGAEVVDAATLHDFIDLTARYGFRPEHLRPCYGMAEVGLAATFSPAGTAPRVELLSRSAITEGRAEPSASDEDAHPYVSCGVPVPGIKIRVVDDTGLDVGDGRVGRILVAAESMMTGYIENPEAGPVLDLRDGWLDTGDLGFQLGGELFVTGRHKDLVILAGRNYQPQSFELAAEKVAGVRPGGAAAVGVPDPASGTERLVMVVETVHHRDPGLSAATADEVGAVVARRTGVRPARVVMVPPRTLPKTSSGKLQRSRVAARVAAGTIG
ncbi:AMP-binding protein [Couchioplanes caeruleus]|uniref:Acyl-CoA synthetase (AMP-forming)/AMP-acid ligase II n=1 Tax=Couchioplanes caeruleus TaxID=56438 RepID=A0A3N1GV31_9ACTN|nr:AMP-binding protein [Couchioplanes caeruleus]ROP34064.1 acyl-CoA synthetase (AMP-forming)/AMP-acid ligase II [Couchioplanes caeruleus]